MFTVNISLCKKNILSHSHQTCTLVNRDTFLVKLLIFFKSAESCCIWYYYEYLYILFNFLELFFLFVAFFHEIFLLIYTLDMFLADRSSRELSKDNCFCWEFEAWAWQQLGADFLHLAQTVWEWPHLETWVTCRPQYLAPVGTCWGAYIKIRLIKMSSRNISENATTRAHSHLK